MVRWRCVSSCTSDNIRAVNVACLAQQLHIHAVRIIHFTAWSREMFKVVQLGLPECQTWHNCYTYWTPYAKLISPHSIAICPQGPVFSHFSDFVHPPKAAPLVPRTQISAAAVFEGVLYLVISRHHNPQWWSLCFHWGKWKYEKSEKSRMHITKETMQHYYYQSKARIATS